ncbi:hypothetical protein H4582DRAFT_1766235, partial [Lactarius indigo]
LIKKFYPQSDDRVVFKFPTNHQLRINSRVTHKLLSVPNCFNSNHKPCIIIIKDSNTTDLTVGHYASLKAYLCDNLGVKSIKLAIYDYDKQSGLFSDKGNSGSLVFN